MKIVFNIASASLVLSMLGVIVTLFNPQFGSFVIYAGLMSIILCIISFSVGLAIISARNCIKALRKAFNNYGIKGVT